mmetsp:Transcript_7592/g.21638  ORF Transcript_7592/g.21638 Transcript_7592/m.21638 type:complete len:186 (+) Transcript_7592:224-781(+)
MTIIAAPTKAEAADGSTATLVFFINSTADGSDSPSATSEVAIRYINDKGLLVFQQNPAFVMGGQTQVIRMSKVNTVSCPHPHEAPESSYCQEKPQADVYNSFTPACCSDGYGGSTFLYTSIAAPVWADYVADCSLADGSVGPTADSDSSSASGISATRPHPRILLFLAQLLALMLVSLAATSCAA